MNNMLISALAKRIMADIREQNPSAYISKKNLVWMLARNMPQLHLRGQNLYKIPSLDGLCELYGINLSHNRLENANGLSDLPLTGYLRLENNRLKTLPYMQYAADIDELNISFNDLRTVPLAIKEMTGLMKLDIRGNVIKTLPAWLGDMENLVQIKVSGNPLSKLPPASVLNKIPAGGLVGTGHRMPRRNVWDLVRQEYRHMVKELCGVRYVRHTITPKFIRELNMNRRLIFDFRFGKYVALPESVGQANLHSLHINNHGDGNLVIDGIPDMADSPLKCIEMSIETLDTSVFEAPELNTLKIKTRKSADYHQIVDAIETADWNPGLKIFWDASNFAEAGKVQGLFDAPHLKVTNPHGNPVIITK